MIFVRRASSCYSWRDERVPTQSPILPAQPRAVNSRGRSPAVTAARRSAVASLQRARLLRVIASCEAPSNTMSSQVDAADDADTVDARGHDHATAPATAAPPDDNAFDHAHAAEHSHEHAHTAGGETHSHEHAHALVDGDAATHGHAHLHAYVDPARARRRNAPFRRRGPRGQARALRTLKRSTDRWGWVAATPRLPRGYSADARRRMRAAFRRRVVLLGRALEDAGEAGRGAAAAPAWTFREGADRDSSRRDPARPAGPDTPQATIPRPSDDVAPADRVVSVYDATTVDAASTEIRYVGTSGLKVTVLDGLESHGRLERLTLRSCLLSEMTGVAAHGHARGAVPKLRGAFEGNSGEFRSPGPTSGREPRRPHARLPRALRQSNSKPPRRRRVPESGGARRVVPFAARDVALRRNLGDAALM